MVEEDANHFASLQFEGDAIEWWKNGMIIQDYSYIASFDEFCWRLVKRFDRKRENDYFRELIYLKQQGVVDDYVSKFHKVTIMI